MKTVYIPRPDDSPFVKFLRERSLSLGDRRRAIYRELSANYFMPGLRDELKSIDENLPLLDQIIRGVRSSERDYHVGRGHEGGGVVSWDS